MRIHVYLREFPASGVSLNTGMTKAVHGLAAGFVANGAHVTVLCDGPETSVVHSPAGYDIRCFAYPSQATSAQMIPRGLTRYIEQCDDGGLFLINGAFNPNAYLVSRVCKRNNIPYVIAPHDPYHPSIFATRRHLKIPYWYLREKPMLQQARAVQVLDFRHAEWLRRWGVHTPALEVVNGFAPEDVQPLDALTWRSSGPARMLYLGRIDSHNKGLDLLLQAFAELADKTDAQLTIQGPDWGDKAAMLKLADSLQLGNRVQFREPDFKREAALISADHDVFLMPSRFEGFGLSALEAMLAGRVILVSDIAGISPHVRAAGCGYVISADVQTIKRGMLRMLSQRAHWQEMGMAGREYALRELRWERIAAKTLDSYRQMLRTPAAPTATPQTTFATAV